MIKAISFDKYKCFKDRTEFDKPSLVNLIIGKNNSGKSSFLNIIRFLFEDNVDTSNELLPKIYVDYLFDDKNILSFFNYTKRNDGFDPLREDIYRIIRNAPLKVAFDRKKNDYDIEGNQPLMKDVNNYLFRIQHYFSPSIDWNKAIKEIKTNICYANYKVIKVAAERDVTPEVENANCEVLSNGQNLTNAFWFNYIDSKGDRNLINRIRNEINDILDGEDHYDDLLVQRDDKMFTIALTNENGTIKLNEMGSGLKTIIFVLFSLYNSLKLNKKIMFMFEELENNLHPEIQRRLFNKIYDFATKYNTPVYITSHSHVAINCFYGKNNTAVYHIFKSEGTSKIEKIESNLSKSDILDDLGVKASDIFQTNGVIWVEGPSDRVYLKSWLKIIAPDLEENTNFTFLYYGGRLLSHFSANKNNGNMISILLENRHSAIIIDSDKRSKDDAVNETKQRIIDEFAKNNMFCWVTAGKEIENYISKDSLKRKYNLDFEQIGTYQLFPDYISGVEPGFLNEKVKFAQELNFNEEDLNVIDLKDRINELACTIRKWNQ